MVSKNNLMDDIRKTQNEKNKNGTFQANKILCIWYI